MEKLILIILISLVTGITGNYHSYSQSNLKSRYSAGFLISDGTLPLDYAGAYEVLGQSGMKVFTIGRTTDTVKVGSNMQILPNYSIDNVPEFAQAAGADILGGSHVRRVVVSNGRAIGVYILTVCG